MRMKVSRGQQPVAEGDGGARGATPRLRTWPGGARMPGARAASPGGIREGRSGGDQGTPRPGDTEFKLRPPGARPRTRPNNCCKARGQRANCWNIPQQSVKIAQAVATMWPRTPCGASRNPILRLDPDSLASNSVRRGRWPHHMRSLTGEAAAPWRLRALGRRRFGLQRRLRGRATTGPAHRKAECAQARMGKDVIWQIRADSSEFPQAAPCVLCAVPGQLFLLGARRCFDLTGRGLAPSSK